MTLGKIIEIASKAYGCEDAVQWCFDDSVHCEEDGLAAFIARELKDTYDPEATDKEQIEAAVKALRSAQEQILDVIEGLLEHH